MDYRVLLASAAVIVGILGYITYYRDILWGNTKPHPFSWLGFALLTGITFFAQLSAGGGAGAWVTGISAIATAGIAALALKKGERRVTLFDWFCFLGALFGIVLWLLTGDPLTAVIIVVIVDTLAFAPTFRKAYLRPHEESITNYGLSAVKYFIALFALASFNFTTALYPISLILSNAIFVGLMIYRRRVDKRTVIE